MRRPNGTAGLKDLAAMDTTSRLEALTRANDYAQVLRWHADHPNEEVSTSHVLTMLEQNYLVRVAEVWRLYQASDAAAQGDEAGAGFARINARECLKMLAAEDTMLTNILKDFGKIVPKSLQIHGKAKDTLDALRELKKVADQGGAVAKRPRGRPRKLLKAPIPPVIPDEMPANPQPTS